MTTLQGIISRSVDNATKQFETLGYITTNVSNYNTVGYKTQRFENYLMENGRLEGTLRTDYSNGMFYATKKPLDVAIDGAGFFPVIQKNGLVAYTRDGSFTVNSEGYLVTKDNAIVGDGIKIPPEYHKLKIAPDGTVTVISARDIEPEVVGKIPVVIFNNAEGLKSIEGNNLIATNESGNPTLVKDHSRIKQGNLERSNVNIVNCVDDVLRLNASLISSVRLIKIVDEFYRQSINLRQ
ncbi:MAG: Flagellar basal-body rod protein FlgG [uncultured bacterium]|nr:MAG: Flagellar basal-body rod protein FlgG [uncultured bacterium]